MPAAHALIRRARLLPVAGVPAPDKVVDLRIRDGFVTDVAPHLAADGAEVHDADGRWAAPGLWDEHVHLGQWVQLTSRLDTAGTHSPEAVLELVRGAVARALPGTTIEGWGHRLSLWTREPTVAELDAVSGDHPVVLISGDAHHAWMNTAALELLHLPLREGVVREEEWFTSFHHLLDLPGVLAAREAAYPSVVKQINALGVVGVGDMEFTSGHLEWPDRYARGVRTLRVRAATYEAGLDSALAAGLRTGQGLPGCDDIVTMGPLKIISDGSLGTQTAYCCQPYPTGELGVQNYAPERLHAVMARAKAGGLECAVHAIGDAAMRDVLHAFRVTGAQGSVEHLQLINDGDAVRIARLGVRASVQPAHLLDDRDVMDRVWRGRGPRCFALRDLLDAGVDVRLGSDAPVSPLNPWLELAAAVHRSADDRAPWFPEQAITAAEAFACSTDGQPTLGVGSRGDVILLDDDPTSLVGGSADVAARLRELRPVATFVAGDLVWSA